LLPYLELQIHATPGPDEYQSACQRVTGERLNAGVDLSSH